MSARDPGLFPGYPPSWPRCVVCGDYALDGHLTCGRAECGTQREVEERVSGIRPSREPASGPPRASRGPRLRVWPVFAFLGALAGSAGAGDLTVQEAYPGSRLRPGSDANPYELRQDGRRLGRLEEESPPTRWLVPGSESNPYRVRPRRDATDDGFDGFGAFDDEEDE